MQAELVMIIAVAILQGPAGRASLIPARVTCKQVSTCEEAVQIWCDGYRRADGDGDGIPCENVCDTVEQVDKIRASRGC